MVNLGIDWQLFSDGQPKHRTAQLARRETHGALYEYIAKIK